MRYIVVAKIEVVAQHEVDAMQKVRDRLLCDSKWSEACVILETTIKEKGRRK